MVLNRISDMKAERISELASVGGQAPPGTGSPQLALAELQLQECESDPAALQQRIREAREHWLWERAALIGAVEKARKLASQKHYYPQFLEHVQHLA